MKKVGTLILICSLFIFASITMVQAQENETSEQKIIVKETIKEERQTNINETKNKLGIKIGDYIEFGSYYGEPILWRIINFDKEGDPLLFSDKIITFKAFDSAGPKGSSARRQSRITGGSNLWRDSNLRQWLNSSDQNIKWIQNPPSAEGVFNGSNAYDKEKGFLAEGNFTEAERSIIKKVSHRSLLFYFDKELKEGGSQGYFEFVTFSEVMEKYDDMYYHHVEDKVFLLDVKEFYDYVYGNAVILGEEFGIGKPTKKALTDTIHDANADIYTYWLRTPFATDSLYFSGAVMTLSNPIKNIGYYGQIFHSPAANGERAGVRPGLYLNTTAVNIQSGSGTESNPYKFE